MLRVCMYACSPGQALAPRDPVIQHTLHAIQWSSTRSTRSSDPAHAPRDPVIQFSTFIALSTK